MVEDLFRCWASKTPSSSCKSCGITGSLTSRTDLLIFDDVEVPNNSATDMQREKLLQLITEAESILTPKMIPEDMLSWDTAVDLHRLPKAGRA